MFKVTFSSNSEFDGDCQTVFKADFIEPCVEMSLALHRSSNVPHTVAVVYQPLAVPSSEDVVHLTLTLKEKDKKQS